MKSDQMKATAADVFNADGSFKSEATIEAQGKTMKITVTGTWKVVEGCLVEVIETSDSPAVQKGRTSKDEIVAASAKEITIKTEDGNTVVMTKLDK